MPGREVLTITMLARWAETSAYTPPEEPTTGAVMSATDTAKDPGAESENSRMLVAALQPHFRPSDAFCSGKTPEQKAPSLPSSVPRCLAAP